MFVGGLRTCRCVADWFSFAVRHGIGSGPKAPATKKGCANKIASVHPVMLWKMAIPDLVVRRVSGKSPPSFVHNFRLNLGKLQARNPDLTKRKHVARERDIEDVRIQHNSEAYAKRRHLVAALDGSV